MHRVLVSLPRYVEGGGREGSEGDVTFRHADAGRSNTIFSRILATHFTPGRPPRPVLRRAQVRKLYHLVSLYDTSVETGTACPDAPSPRPHPHTRHLPAPAHPPLAKPPKPLSPAPAVRARPHTHTLTHWFGTGSLALDAHGEGCRLGGCPVWMRAFAVGSSIR